MLGVGLYSCVQLRGRMVVGDRSAEGVVARFDGRHALPARFDGLLCWPALIASFDGTL